MIAFINTLQGESLKDNRYYHPAPVFHAIARYVKRKLKYTYKKHLCISILISIHMNINISINMNTNMDINKKYE